jgi:hyperpolarization activated cyclic nucleotide-gated potassium channel 2
MVVVLATPVTIGFDIADSTKILGALYFIMASFFVDMCVTFNTAYVDEETEKLIDDRRLIAQRYIYFWFWIDLISTIPIDHIVQAYADVTRLDFIRMIRIFRLFRLLRFFHFLKKADRLETFGANPQIVNLGVLMVQLFFVAHIFACFWHYITLPQAAGSYPLNWVDHFGFSDHTIFDKYVTSLYYVIITMLTIGYGDIYATNQLERMYAIMTMLTGGVVFGALVSNITSFIDKRNPQERAYKENMKEFKLFISETTLSQAFKQRCIVSYFDFILLFPC